MSDSIDAQLDLILPHISKPARYVGGELNAIVKDHARCTARIALAFPDTYEIGMSNLALAILYDVVNRREDWVAERVYAPWPDMEQAMRDRGVPLFTLETRTPVRDYDVFGISLAYEMSYTNVLNMIDLAGLPVHGAERDAVGGPVVIAGGHCAMNPEPLAPFVDAFVIGEGEEALVELVSAVVASRDLPRCERLLRLAAIPGVYVPRFYEPAYGAPAAAPEDADPRFAGADRRALTGTHPVRPDVPATVTRRMIEDVNALPYPEAVIVPFVETVHDRISLEVMRGCTRGCRFCQAGMITRPVREKSPERLLEIADALVRSTGHEEISLVSLSTADHSGVEAIVRGLIDAHGESKVGISLPSLRADRDCVHLLEQIQRVRKAGLTFAPEAGTQRMRDVVNKNVTEADLFDAVETAFGAGWQRVKLYFMIGLPTETDEDVIGIADLANRVARIGRRMHVPGLKIGLGVSPFVPKPHTPFQWHAQDTLSETERKQRLVRDHLRDKAVELRRADARTSHIEGVLALGDRRLAPAIEHAWRAGATFDAWDDRFSYERWMDAFEAAGVDPFTVANRERHVADALAWDHILCDVSKGYLRAELNRARAATATADCHEGPCTLCQACDRFTIELDARKAARAERKAAPSP